MSNSEWDKLYNQYLENKDVLDDELFENVEDLLFHPEGEYISQGCLLLYSLGPEQFCRYLELCDGQLGLKSSLLYRWVDPFLIKKPLMEIIKDDDIWKPVCESGLLDNLEFQVLGEADYDKQLSQLQRERLLELSKDMVLIPAGKFFRGHLKTTAELKFSDVNVQITKNFYVSKYPVTNVLWSSIRKDIVFSGGAEAISNVNWYEAVAFCNQLSEWEGVEPAYTIDGKNVTCNWDSKGYRLLTDAEWEYAARANQDTIYSGSNNLEEVAWDPEVFDWSQGQPSVGQKKPNSWGLYDMSGNGWEWVWDSTKPGFLPLFLLLLASGVIIAPLGLIMVSFLGLFFDISLGSIKDMNVLIVLILSLPVCIPFIPFLLNVSVVPWTDSIRRRIVLKDPRGKASGTGRIMRGGTFFIHKEKQKGRAKVFESRINNPEITNVSITKFRICRNA